MRVFGGFELQFRLSLSVGAVFVTAAAAGLRLVLRALGDEALRREHEARDGGGVLERRADDLHRVDDALREEVAVLVGRGVVAEVALALLDLVDDDRAFEAGVRRRSGGGAPRWRDG